MIYLLKINLILLLPLILDVLVQTVLCASFNEYITYYEPLNYNKQHLHNEHLRRKRSLDDSLLSLVFNSHKRLFHLRLRQDSSVFKEDAFYSDGHPIDLDLSHIHSGYVEGSNGSYVHGSIIDGVFSGRIEFPDEIFFVEKSEMYFREPTDFHSFVYSDKNVINQPHRTKRSSTRNPGCGVADGHIHEWMKRVQRSAVKPLHRDHTLNGVDEPAGWNKYSYSANRRKRSNGDQARQCSLYLQSDPTLWAYMKKMNYPEEKIKNEITALLASHVDKLNKIFGETAFGPYKGFSFVVYRLQVNSTNVCGNNSTLGFCKTNLDASNFLNIHSLTNHNDYCLAYIFSYREFTQGTIGLAWVGSPSTSGGVCDRWKAYSENSVYVNKSLNTGIVTLCNYDNRVPLRISMLTFSHEVGHSFGSPHDSGPTCIPTLANPSDKAGNYLMFASATSGLQTNNEHFSTCSIGNITDNLNSIMTAPVDGVRASCFTTREDAFCGNGIIETNSAKNISEECDCGFEDDCLSDGCCYPRISGSDNDQKACKRKEGKKCSKSEGPCCSSIPGDCTFVPESANMTCKQETECTEPAYCHGLSVKCPLAEAKKDKTPCNHNTQMCKSGECATSICDKISWRSCSIQPPADDKSFDLGQLCYISCLNPSTNSCVSTGNIQDMKKPENIDIKNLLIDLNLSKSDGSIKGIQMPPGAPCNNYRGYCDVFYKCRPVNEEGPLAQLTKLLFNEQTISEIRDWVTAYWWACLLVGVGIIIFMAFFIKVCAVHTPSSNPKLKKARQLSLRRKKKQQSDTKLTVSSISSGADILRNDKTRKPPRTHDSPF